MNQIFKKTDNTKAQQNFLYNRVAEMYLKNIIQSLDHRWTINFNFPNTPTFTHLLKSLQPIEKDYVGGYITKKEWNLGSSCVLDILQHSGILRMSDFMVAKIETEDAEEVQLIFNDLLETQQLSLLADLVENIERTDPRSQLVTQCLNEGFRRFVADISTGCYALQRNYLHEIKSLVTDEQMEKIRILNLKLLMERTTDDGHPLEEAITRLSGWISDKGNNMNAGLTELVKELLYDQEKVVNYLIKKVFSDQFCGWSGYVIVLRILSSRLKTPAVNVLKTFLKELYASFLIQKNRKFFLIMILTARVLCAGDEERFGDYAQWHRNQFSDMRYRISKDDFASTMEILQTLVSYENDVDILQIYVRTAIAPATFCNDLVLSFKQMCRSKIERLKLDRSGDRATTESIVLIDDDDENMEF